MKRYVGQFWVLYIAVAILLIAICTGGSRAVTVMVENMPINRDVVFVIDAGHGGEDGGAVSCTGVRESVINLQIALRLEDLMHLLGYETVMIRASDCDLHTAGNSIGERKLSDLKERVQIVNETENAVLISIHQNMFSESKYSGAQMFYNDHCGAKELAQRLQAAFVQMLNPGSNRKCKPVDSIYLLEHIDRPGVLVECGFLSNATEERKLRDGEYQKQICCVIAAVLAEFAFEKANT